MSSDRRARAAASAVFVVTLGGLLAFAARTPRYEWDLLGYVGVVMSWRSSDQSVHTRTYQALAEAAPEAAVRELTGSLPYREALATDARAFDAQLPFYRARVGYTLPIRALTGCGFSAVHAAYAVSLLGAALSAIVAFAWCTRRAPPWAALTVTWLVLFASGWFETARLATPDALAAAWVLLGAWLLLERRRPEWAAAAFLLAVPTRPDAMLVVLALWLSARPLPPARSWWGVRPYELLPLALFAFLFTGARSAHGAWIVFVHTFDGWLVDPLQAPPFSIGLWAATVAAHLGEWLSAPPLFVAVGVVLVVYARRLGDRPMGLRIALALAAALALRYLLFPALWPRLCQPHVALAGLLAVSALSAVRRPARHPAPDVV